MWERILTYEIQPEDAGKTVAAYLRSRGFSRHLLIRLKTMPDGITLNGVPVLPSYRFFQDHVKLAEQSVSRSQAYTSSGVRNPGDTSGNQIVSNMTPETNVYALSKAFYDAAVEKPLLTVRLREEEASEHITPVSLPLHIVYEDEDLLVLDKAPDMPIHSSVGNYENTLANGLAYYYEQQGRPFIFRCINRLDRDTSGLLIVAKNAYSSVVLSAQMKERRIHREYLAVVQGQTPESGTIDAPIGRKPGSVIERCVDPVNGETAVTHYARVATSPDGTYSLVRIHLDTGRTHQIRIHMGHIGHPLPGDFLYCPDYRHFERQPLHSHRLNFTHPVTGEEMSFTSPLPEDCHPEWFMI